MKKVLFLLSHLQYSDGVAKVLMDICNSLDPKKYDITVKSVFRFDKDFVRGFNSNIKLDSIFGFYFRGFSKFVNKIPVKILYKMATKNELFDLEVAFQYGISTKIIAGSQNLKAKHVAWMHTYDDGLTQLEYYKSMDTVVCVSKCNAVRLREESKNAVNAKYCYNLVNDELLKKKAEEIIELDNTIHPVFVSVGRHSKEKGYDRLLTILADLKNEGYRFQCWLVGDGPEHSTLLQKSKDLHLDNTVFFTGAQTNPHKYTSKADLFICSSFNEGYSTACTEAAALGVPILTTSVSGGEEIIQKAECGMLVGLDDESLKDGIKRILDEDLLGKWKQVASDTSSKFSLERMKSDMIQTFENLFL